MGFKVTKMTSKYLDSCGNKANLLLSFSSSVCKNGQNLEIMEVIWVRLSFSIILKD